MRTSKIICLFVFLITSLSAKSSIPLSLSEIHEEMGRVMEGHVTKKQIDAAFLADSLKRYIEQFDPYKVYLLSSEVEPFLNLSDKEKETLFKEYKKGNYTAFTRCTVMIEKAIKRMRTFRRGMVANQEVFLGLAAQPFTLPEAYVSTEDELLRRHSIYMAQLVVKELRRIQAEKRQETFKEAVRVIALEFEENENSYLFVDRMGKPLGATEKEEMMAFHILKALTANLDAHTRYLNPAEAQDLRMKLEKNYVGVGIVLEELGRAFVVQDIIKGSSADTTGVIKEGDELVAIDKKPVGHLSFALVQQLLEGRPGTSVQLDFERRSSNGRYKIPISIALQRRQVVLEEGRVDTIVEKIPGGIVGVITLHAFYEGGSVSSEKDVQKALELLRSQGPLKGVILDLRDNRGGFLMQAVKVAGLFIKSGVVVAAKYSNGEIHYFRDLDPSVSYSGPLIVLVSKETASAAEIVAEALKDYGVAIIVGDKKTFGKGSIQLQTVTKGENSRDSYFKVTVGRYYGVSGESTQMQGVKADIVVPGFLFSRKVGEEYLSGALESDTIEPSFSDALPDIGTRSKRWFEKYYIPYLQPKVTMYQKWIPELVKLSSQRMEKNKNYQRLLEGKNSIIERKGLTEITESLTQEQVRQTFRNFQLQETMNIMNDLIKLEGNS